MACTPCTRTRSSWQEAVGKRQAGQFGEGTAGGGAAAPRPHPPTGTQFGNHKGPPTTSPLPPHIPSEQRQPRLTLRLPRRRLLLLLGLAGLGLLLLPPLLRAVQLQGAELLHRHADACALLLLLLLPRHLAGHALGVQLRQQRIGTWRDQGLCRHGRRRRRRCRWAA